MAISSQELAARMQDDKKFWKKSYWTKPRQRVAAVALASAILASGCGYLVGRRSGEPVIVEQVQASPRPTAAPQPDGKKSTLIVKKDEKNAQLPRKQVLDCDGCGKQAILPTTVYKMRDGALIDARRYELNGGSIATAAPFTLRPGEELRIEEPRVVSDRGNALLRFRYLDSVLDGRVITYDEARRSDGRLMFFWESRCEQTGVQGASYGVRIDIGDAPRSERPRPTWVPAVPAPAPYDRGFDLPPVPELKRNTFDRFTIFHSEGPQYNFFGPAQIDLSSAEEPAETRREQRRREERRLEREERREERREEWRERREPVRERDVPGEEPREESPYVGTANRFSLGLGRTHLNAGDSYTSYGFKTDTLTASWRNATRNFELLAYGVHARGTDPLLDDPYHQVTDTIDVTTGGARLRLGVFDFPVRPALQVGGEYQSTSAGVSYGGAYGHEEEYFEDSTGRIYPGAGLLLGDLRGNYLFAGANYINETRNQQVGLLPEGIKAVQEDMLDYTADFRLMFGKDRLGIPAYELEGSAHYMPEIRTYFSNTQGQTIAEHKGEAGNFRLQLARYFGEQRKLGIYAGLGVDREVTPFRFDPDVRHAPTQADFFSGLTNDYWRNAVSAEVGGKYRGLAFDLRELIDRIRD